MSVALVVMVIAHLIMVLSVPLSSLAAEVVAAMIAGAIFVGHQGCRALIQEGPSLVFLAGVIPICAWCCMLVYVAPASPVPALTLKSGAGVTTVTPHWCRLFVGLQCTW
jgi:hypothetical protein